MKRIKLIILILVSTISTGSSQTLFVPSGTGGIGTSSNTNVGIGISSPSYKLDVSAPADVWKAIFQGPDGYILIGPNNSGWAHIYTDRPNFIFNKNVWSIPGGFSSYNNADLTLQTNGTTRLTISKATGNVGIGISSPTAKLEIIGPATGSGATLRASGGGDVVMNGGGSLFFDGNYSYASGNYIRPLAANTQAFFTAGSERVRITSTGNVGIGTTSPNQKLTVNGTIYGKEVKVDLSVPVPDYVFERDYRLPSLEELKIFIKQNKHLPEVPSAKELGANGIEVGAMNMLLLKKIEELTLYVIQLQNENRKQDELIHQLQNNK